MSDPQLPGSLARDPHLDSWIRLEEDGIVTVFTGKVEIGQGIATAIAQIAAEELDVAFEHIRVVTANTARTPDELLTAGSLSVAQSGSAVRQASAEARHYLLSLAADEWEVPVDDLTVDDGTVKNPQGNQQATYWALTEGKPFGVDAAGAVIPKAAADYAVVGTSVARLDLPGKLMGAPSFVQDMRLPGMVFGRVVRPPSYGARLDAFDDTSVKALPGVLEVVRDGRFLGVIAEREDQAVRARSALADAVQWAEEASLPNEDRLFEWLINQPTEDFLVVGGTPQEGEIPTAEIPEAAAETLEAMYCRPFHMHASIGPSAAVAQLIDGKLTVWSHSQGVFLLRRSLAIVLGMSEDDIHVVHEEGAGCYGHNGADDVALDAALLARSLPGRPVSVQWTREDENAWEPYGPAMVVQSRASLDDRGRIVDWSFEVTGNTHVGRPFPNPDDTGLLAAWHLAEPMARTPDRPMLMHEVGLHRNATPYYDFPRSRIVKRFVREAPLRTSTMRGLGAYANVFAIESFMDELAHAAGADPIGFRLAHLKDGRAKAVIQAAAEKIGWGRDPGAGRGLGLGFARYENEKCYAAVAVELEVERGSGKVILHRAAIAGDAGQIVNPDGLANQFEGGFIQAASWTLKEQVRFDHTRITSLDWENYPILGFADVPEIDCVLLNQPGEPFLGSGEGTQGPTPAAIANAIFAATGMRLRELPFTPERVKRMLG